LPEIFVKGTVSSSYLAKSALFNSRNLECVESRGILLRAIMRRVRMLMLGLLMPLTGCNMFWYAGHNLIQEPRARIDEYQVTRRLRSEAEISWSQVCQQYDKHSFSREYADGFVEGYIDFIEHGGVSRPPTVPPPRYRRAAYLTPSGHERAKDYLIGFKYGADVAQQSGRRQFHTIPVLLPEPRSDEPLSINLIPEASPTPVAPIPVPAVPEAPKAAVPLPVPKAVPMVPAVNPLPEPRPILSDPPKIKTTPAPSVPEVITPAVPLPAEVRPSGGPIPGVDDIIQAISQSAGPEDLPVLELPIRGPRGFDARYLAPTLWLPGDEAPGH
jgi:hypothetical protein